MHEERAAEAQLSFKLRIDTDRQVLLLGLVVTDGMTDGQGLFWRGCASKHLTGVTVLQY